MTKPNQPCFIRRAMPEKVSRIHLIGIAGAAMGSFALMLRDAGYEVRGSDQNVYPPMSDVLSARGIQWAEGFAAENVHWSDGLPDLVIVGNVCRKDNPEALEAEKLGIVQVSFPQAFSDLFLQGEHPVVITGTHGKTTTTALTAWLLMHANRDPGLLVGGVSLDFDASYRLREKPGDGPFVVEGDEYDTAFFDKGPKFLHYRPEIVVMNNIEFDHADIYDSLDEIVENFDRLVDLLGPGKTLIANADDELVMKRAEWAKTLGVKVVTYGFGEADFQAIDVELCDTGSLFTLVHNGKRFEVNSPLAGRHNIWNTLAAFAVGREFGVDLPELIEGLKGYKGVKKRQEVRSVGPQNIVIIDDYAHHPTAVRYTLEALAAKYHNCKIWAIYEPKSNTARQNIHQREYASAFDAAHVVIFAPAFAKHDDFPAYMRLNLPRLCREIGARPIYNGHGPAAFALESVDRIVEFVAGEVRPNDVIVCMSSSGFGNIYEKLRLAIEARTDLA